MDENLLEKVYDAGANTIWAEMKKLRGQASEQKEIMRRRWVWELIQNASDCTPNDKKININISNTNERYLEFSHNGVPFTYENLVDLITQISSKEGDVEEKTGKFGTGFISTHLLSEKVTISGVLKKSLDMYMDLNLLIDRSGTSYTEIRDNIKDTLSTIVKMKQNNNDEHNIMMKDRWKTSFNYDTSNSLEAREAITEGLTDLNKSAPIVLAINNSISSIEYNGIKFTVDSEIKVTEDWLIRINKTSKDRIDRINILIKSDGELSILVFVQEQNGRVTEVLPFPDKIPKLFCNFPLVGTEEFCFPVIINCSKFDVERDRNGILEGNPENKEYLERAVKLYGELLNLGCKNKWKSMYNLCFLPKLKDSTVQKHFRTEIVNIYEQLPIVDVNLNGNYNGRGALKNSTHDLIGIPNRYDSEEVSNEFWELVNSYAKFYIPTKDTYLEWYKVGKVKIDIPYINKEMKSKSLEEFKGKFNGNIDSLHTWLNKYYSLWIKIKGEEDFIQDAWVLSQNDKFIEASRISLDDNIDNALKKIASDLGDNLIESLLVREVNIPEDIIKKKIDNRIVAKRIQDKINQILSDETLNNKQRSIEHQGIFNRLTNWFLENPKPGEDIFDQLYNKRNLLSTPEENIRRFKIAEKIESNNIEYEQLDDMINNHHRIAELIDNLSGMSGEEIRSQLVHISSNSSYAREKFNLMLEESIKNVYIYLHDNDIKKYHLAESLEDWIEQKYSKTVFRAKKDGKEIRIVIRPGYQNKIIFYYDEEIEALDDTNYELWTYDGQGNTRMITLGDILRTTGFTSIPLG
ncbi:sacsin N-terminal ATP-binding-like domain-containing protein [Paenibacillus yanchengensis]|uniref:Sacsin N-terminal ATP-binding-like domain-containing protein n=1 Tax=Paenibacillus yanchengensis TaxID=2035833 RepID=A0ABW4YJC0_9BACL